MKKKIDYNNYIILFISISIICHMCGVSKYPTSSNPGTHSLATGIKYNSPYGLKVKPYTKITGSNGIYVEGGEMTISNDLDGRGYLKNKSSNRSKTVYIPSMKVDQTVFTNIVIAELLNWVKKFSPKEYSDFYKKLKQDPSVWKNDHSYNDPIVKLYDISPKFRYYPAVGLNFVQAFLYCFLKTLLSNFNIIYNMKKYDLYKDFGKYTLKEIANYDLKEIEGHELAKFADLKLSQFSLQQESDIEEESLEEEGDEEESEEEFEEEEEEFGDENPVYDALDELRNDGKLEPPYTLPTRAQYLFYSVGSFKQKFQKSLGNQSFDEKKDLYENVTFKDKYNGTRTKVKDIQNNIIVKNQKPNPWNSLRFRDKDGRVINSRKLGPGLYTDNGMPPYVYKYKPNSLGIIHCGVSEFVLDVYREVTADQYHDLHPIFRKNSNLDRESDYKDFNPMINDRTRIYMGPNYLDTFSKSIYTTRPIPEWGTYSKKSFIGFRSVQIIVNDTYSQD